MCINLVNYMHLHIYSTLFSHEKCVNKHLQMICMPYSLFFILCKNKCYVNRHYKKSQVVDIKKQTLRLL